MEKSQDKDSKLKKIENYTRHQNKGEKGGKV